MPLQLHISEKNSKIGAIPNISLTPGVSCVPGIPCVSTGCYALKAYNRYPNVRKAWDENLAYYKENSVKFFTDLSSYLRENSCERFRFFVGGDFVDEEFYFLSAAVARVYSETKFLAFSKRYNYDYSKRPENLQIILSVWPGWTLPENTDLPWAWLECDPRRPKTDFFMCGGSCSECSHQCWYAINSRFPVVFPKH